MEIAECMRLGQRCPYDPMILVEPFKPMLLECVKPDMASFLEPTLESLRHQTFKDFETIIVDWHIDKRRYIAGKYSDLEVKHVHDQPCPWFDLKPPKGFEATVEPAFQNVGGARNFGAILADGELLCFMDDNIILEPKTLDRAWSWYKKGYGVKLIRNRYDIENRKIRLYREFKEEDMYKPLWERGRMPYSYRGAWSHGFTLPLRTFLEVNGFEEVMIAGAVGAEDIDLGNRLYNLLERGRRMRMMLDVDATIWEIGHYHIHRGRPPVRFNMGLLDICRNWEKDVIANTRKPTEEELAEYKQLIWRRGERLHPYWDRFLVEPFSLKKRREEYRNVATQG